MTELTGGVTNADLYRELVSMRADVTRALTHLEVIDTRNTAADLVHRDHEERLRVLEQFRARLLGTAVTVSFVSGAASGLIGYILGHIR